MATRPPIMSRLASIATRGRTAPVAPKPPAMTKPPAAPKAPRMPGVAEPPVGIGVGGTPPGIAKLGAKPGAGMGAPKLPGATPPGGGLMLGKPVGGGMKPPGGKAGGIRGMVGAARKSRMKGGY